MKTQAFNPFLPSYEYIPDAEPRIFDGRIYIYGSHDRFGGDAFCQNDYVCWSAAIDNLADWRYEGVIYKKDQDPLNADGSQRMYAPDAIQGVDGRYYLFYALNKTTVISVAVCDTPAGSYSFHGHVQYPDGRIWGSGKNEVNNFDPAIFIDNDSKIYLYSGFSHYKAKRRMEIALQGKIADGSYCVQLEKDMLTMRTEPVLVAPGIALSKGTSFEGHAFFEASSLRKINDLYYFIYSSQLSHELCYATSNFPDRDFTFKGTIVSIADFGYKDNKTALNYYGNTHGSIASFNNSHYIFYHRHTNLSPYSRQACAERIYVDELGVIGQVEVTSMGLNDAPLIGSGKYEARIACNLSAKEGAAIIHNPQEAKGLHPYFTQTGQDRQDNPDQYIANMRDGSYAGFKYFDFDEVNNITVEISGDAQGLLEISTSEDRTIVSTINIAANTMISSFSAAFTPPKGVHPLYFTFKGTGALNFHTFTMF